MAKVERALVTGAAGAIGAALAAALRQRDAAAELVLVDVDHDGLKAAARRVGGPVTLACWDLSRPEELAARWAELSAPIDVLINCAGIMEVRSVAGTPWELGQRLLNVDLVSPLRLMSLALPDMLERGRGAIVNVSSMAGVTPLRGCSYYGAAKAGLAQASEIARLELQPRGVRVLTVYPGPVRSGLERRARAQLPQERAVRWVPTGSPAALATRVLDALDADAPRVVYPALYELASRAPRVAGWITSRISPMPLS